MSSIWGRSLLNLNSNHALRSLRKSWISSTSRGRNKNLLPKMLKAINRKWTAWRASRWLKKKKKTKFMNLKLQKVIFPKSIACSFSYYYFMFYLQGSHFETFMTEGIRASCLSLWVIWFIYVLIPAKEFKNNVEEVVAVTRHHVVVPYIDSWSFTTILFKNPYDGGFQNLVHLRCRYW